MKRGEKREKSKRKGEMVTSGKEGQDESVQRTELRIKTNVT